MKGATATLMLLAVLATGAPGGSATAAFAPEPVLRLAQSERISAREAARIAQEQYGGKVLSVELRQPQNAPPYYLIKLLTNGNVREVRVRAER